MTSPAQRFQRRPVRLGQRAAMALLCEFTRDNGPKTGLLAGVAPGSGTLTAAIDTLRSGDRLTVVAADADQVETLREEVAAHGTWVTQRVTVVPVLDAAEPANVVMLATVVSGTAEEALATVEGLVKLVVPGGVLSVAVPASTLPDPAVDEVERQAVLHGVGSDLVLRNVPPVRVHRLRHSTADHSDATRLNPITRPSSVPLTRGMHIDSNGVAAAGIAVGLAAIVKAARPKSRLWLVPALAAAPVAAFFRDPQRQAPQDETSVLAASDGKVLSVERITDTRFGEQPFLRIAVFLSVFDVHVNRAPVAGRVVDHFVEDGGYAAAMKPAAEHNVAAYTVLETDRGRVVVAQRTGLIARRIVQRAPVGSLLARGERFGLIRFGSRTDVYLPADRATALVAPTDRVVAGVTPIARWDA